MRCGKGGGKFQERQEMEGISSTRHQSRELNCCRVHCVRNGLFRHIISRSYSYLPTGRRKLVSVKG